MTSRPPRSAVALRLVLAVSLAFLTLPILSAPATADHASAPTSVLLDGNQDGLTDDWQGYDVGDQGFTRIQDGLAPNDPSGIDGQERDFDGVSPEKDWTSNKATASPKSDIGNVLVSSYRAGGAAGNLFAAIGLDRGGDTGTQRYYFELNQQRHDLLMPQRTRGDVRVVIGINGSSSEECQGAQTWDGQWGAVKNGVFVPGDRLPCGGNIDFRVNEDPIIDYFGSPFAVDDDNDATTPRKIPANQFFELSLNLTGLGATSCPVSGFKTFNMRTQEGNENGDTGQLKDVIRGAIDIPSDCGAIHIVKKDAATDAAVTLAGATFRIAPDPTSGAAGSSRTVTDNDAAVTAGELPDGDSRVGYVSVLNVLPGFDYTLTEITPPGQAGDYLLPPPCVTPAEDADRCTTKTVGRGGQVTFTFTDYWQYDAPTVTKTVDARYSTSYTWSVDKGVRVNDGLDGATTPAYAESARRDVPATTDPTQGGFQYQVTASVRRQTSEYRVTGTVKVHNTNTRPIVVTLSDQLTHQGTHTACTFPGVGDVSATTDGLQVSVAAGAGEGQAGYGYTCSPAAGDRGDGSNNAVVTWDKSVYPQTQGDVDALADGNPQTPGTGSAQTGAVAYSFQPSTPEVNKTALVTDDRHGSWAPQYADPWVMTWQGTAETYSETRTYRRNVAARAGRCDTERNTARVVTNDQAATVLAGDSADATVCSGADLTVRKVTTGTFTRTYPYTIEKRAVGGPRFDVTSGGSVSVPYEVVVTDGDCTVVEGEKVCEGYQDSDWRVTGTITVSNPNAWQDVTLTDVTDVYAGLANRCTITQSAPYLVPRATVDPQSDVKTAGALVLDYTCTYTAQQPPPYDGTNVATVTWSASTYTTPSGSAQGTDTVTYVADSATDDWAETPVNRTVRVLDDKTVPGAVHDLGTVTWNSVGHEHAPIRYSVDLAGVAGTCTPYTNLARVVVNTGAYDPVTNRYAAPSVLDSDDARVSVCRRQDLTVSKTGSGTFRREYLWRVEKDIVDPETVHVDAPTTSHRFDYVVKAFPNGYRDSGWTASGTITVSNPNDYEGVEVDVTDVPGFGAGAECTLTGADNRVVPAESSIEVPWSCTVPDPVDAAGDDTYAGNTNTATATWDGGSASSAAVAIPFTLPSANKTNETVDVTDDKVTLTTPVKLGTATWNSAGTPAVFDYSLTHETVAGACENFLNTAYVQRTGTTGTDGRLAPPASDTARLCVRLPLQVANEPVTSFDRSYLWTIEKAADRTEAEVSGSDQARFGYTVTVGPRRDAEGGRLAPVDSGWTMTGSITVTNPNTDDIGAIAATVSDRTDLGGTCTITGSDSDSVAPGVPAVFGYTCSFPSSGPTSYSGTNTARVDFTGAGGATSASDVESVTYTDPTEHDRHVSVTDAFDGFPAALLHEPADELDWTSFTDSGPTRHREFTYYRDLGAPAGGCDTYPNVARIVETGQTAQESVTVCAEALLTLDKTVTATYERTYHWRLDKVAAQLDDVEVTSGDTGTFDYSVTATPVAAEGGGYTDHSFAMSGTITVTNPNTYEGGSITATVTDVPHVGPNVTCDVVDGVAVELAPGASETLGYRCEISGTPDYTGSNEALASWTGPGDVARTATSDSDPEIAGDQAKPVTFALVKEIDETVTVFDDKTKPGQRIELGTATWNSAGTPTTFTYRLPLTGQSGRCTDFVNTATLPLEGGPDLSDTATVTLCVEADALLANIVTASYDRSYAWSLTKAADGTSFSAGDAGTARVGYTVQVTPGAATDSGWTMGGALTVSNPNSFKSLTVGVSTLTSLGAGTTCALTPGQDMAVPANGSRTFTYTCSFAAQPAYAGTDSTTVTWDKVSVQIDTPVTFALDQETDRTVDVVDDQTVPGRVVPLGQATWNDTGAATVFSYALDLAAEANACETYTNTAAIVRPAHTATATVEVCGPVILPAQELRPERPRPPLVIKGVGTLPSTGGPDAVFLRSGIGLVLAGCGLLLARRRRSEA